MLVAELSWCIRPYLATSQCELGGSSEHERVNMTAISCHSRSVLEGIWNIDGVCKDQDLGNDIERFA